MNTITSFSAELPVNEAVSSDDSPPILNNFQAPYQIDQSIKLFFNKAVMAGGGEVIISNGSDMRTISIYDTNQVTFDGDTVKIDPTTDLMVDTTYNIQMSSGVIVDAEGREFAGIDNAMHRTEFTTVVARDPQLSEGITLDRIEFQVDENIKLSFDERVMAGKGHIVISNGTDTRTIAIDDTSQVDFTTFSGGKVIINPTEDLLGDTVYSLQIGEGVITDEERNPFAGVSDVTIATITTDPEILSSDPINHSTMKLDADIQLFFDRTVTAGLGDITISNGEDTRTIAIDDTSQVTFNLNGVFINPADDLIVDTTYTVQMEGGVIADTAGHDYTGFKDATVTILSSNPILTNSSLGVLERMLIDDDIEFFFDEEVTAGSGNIIISNGADTRTIAANDTSQISFGLNSLIVDPTEDLIPDTIYTIQIESGAVIDLAGHIYTGVSNLDVTPVDSNPLITSITSSSNTNFGVKVDDSLHLFFNEIVEAGDGNIVISNGTDTRTIAISDTSQITPSQPFDLYGENSLLTIDPTTNLVANTTYTVQIDQGVVTDAAGHAFVGLSDIEFPTIASDPLLVVSPENGLIIEPTIEIDDDIQLFFDEEVQAGNGDIVLSNGTDTLTINVGDTNQVSFSIIPLGSFIAFSEPFVSYALTISPTEDLAPNTTYTVQIDSGVVMDTAGHAYSGLDSVTFSTMTSEPRLIDSNPIEGSTIKTDDDIELQFDETVMAGSGAIVLSSGTDTRTIAVTDTSQVSFNGSKVTINPTEDLNSDTTYSVQMASGAIVDEVGNSYEGFSDTKITATNSNPLLTHSNPTEGSLIKTNGSIRLQFDENVVAGSGDIVLSNGSDIRTIAVNDTSQVHFNGGKVVEIDPTEDLIADTTYSVQMTSGVITDKIGNPFVGFSDAMMTTTNAPILLFSPQGTSVSARDGIFLHFDEEVVAGHGDIILSNGADVRTITVDDTSQVVFGDFGNVNAVKINPSENLVADTTYQIQMASGVIVDTDDNPYRGISEVDMLEFTAVEFDTVIGPFSPLL